MLVRVNVACALGFPTPTVMDCWTCVAAAYAPLPTSLKSISQTPLPENVTSFLSSVQPVEPPARLITTVSPDVADAPVA